MAAGDARRGTGLVDGVRAALLIAPGNAEALAETLRGWLTDARVRQRLRDAARERRQSLPAWSTTAAVVSDVLAGTRQ